MWWRVEGGDCRVQGAGCGVYGAGCMIKCEACKGWVLGWGSLITPSVAMPHRNVTICVGFGFRFRVVPDAESGFGGMVCVDRASGLGFTPFNLGWVGVNFRNSPNFGTD